MQCVQMLEGHTNVVMDLLCWDSFLLSCSLDGTVKASVKASKEMLCLVVVFGFFSRGVVDCH